MKKQHFIFAGAAAAFVIVCGIIYWNMPKTPYTKGLLPVNPQTMTVSATKQDAQGIDTQSGLLINCREDVPANALQNFLTISTGGEFKLSRKGHGKYLLTPSSEFDQNKIVNLNVIDETGLSLKSWAFQTKAVFKVLSTVPGNNYGYVPTNTGIEFNFSTSSVDIVEFEKSFSISPKVEGKFKQYGTCIAFVPDKPLDEDTVYTVTLSGNLQAKGGDKLGEDEVISFKTSVEDEGQGQGGIFNAAGNIETFLPGDPPIIEVYVRNEKLRDSEVTTKVYKYPSFEAYMTALEKEVKGMNSFFNDELKTFGTDGLNEVMSFKSKLQLKNGKGYGAEKIIFPNKLEEGWYLAVLQATDPLTGKTLEVKKVLQVTPISLYCAQLRDKMVAWVNDTETGKPAEGAAIEINAEEFKFSAKVGNDGTVSIDTKTDKKVKNPIGILTIANGTHKFADIFTKAEKEELSGSEKYYSYIYTDRPIYMSSDTVKIWGFVKPRNKSDALPKDPYITLSGLYKTPVKLNADGSYTAEIKFEKLGGFFGEWCSIQLAEKNEKNEEVSIGSRGINIADYTKPIYVIDANADKPIYMEPLTTPINVDVAMSFFDGTPASGVPLTGRFADNTPIQQKTGEDGKTRFTFKPVKDVSSWYPESASCNIDSNQAENEYYSKYLSLNLIYRDVMLEGKAEKSGDKIKASFDMNRIDISKVTKDTELWEYEKLKGEPYSTPVTAQLMKVYYTKVAKDSYYDELQKKTITNYDYVRHEDIVDAYTVEIKDGKGILDNLPVSTYEASYFLKLSYKDTKGRETKQDFWMGYEVSPYMEDSINFNLRKQNVFTNDWESRYSFTEGENLNLELVNSEKPVTQGKLLVISSQQEIKNFRVTDTQFKFDYDESNIPNVNVTAAYFDGKKLYAVWPMELKFQPKTRELNVEIKSDKESYNHGEKAKVSLLVTDKKTGKPVKNAAVSLSVVDEAIFAISPEDINVVGSLYSAVYYPSLRTYVSYVEHKNRDTGGAEKGGGGGDYMRTKFVDTAAFFAASTDSNGKAEFSFDMPDNYTSWRMTAQAVTADLNAGNAKKNVVTTGTFFLQPVMPKTALTGDDMVVSLRSYGTAINTDSAVEYTGKITSILGYTDTVTASGKAGSFTHLKFKAPPKGSYTVTLEASSGKLKDGIKQPLRITDSAIEVSLTKDFDLGSGIDIEPERFPVVLGFYNKDYSLIADILDNLARTQGERTDQRIARRYSTDLMARLSSSENIAPLSDDLIDVLSSDGSAKLFRYSEIEPELSAKAAMAAPDYFFGLNPYSYFEQLKISDNGTEATCGYLGLAAQKQPVLNEIKVLLEKPDGLSELDQLRLVAALAVIGDHTGADEYYTKLIKPKLTDGKTEKGEPTCFMAVSEDKNIILSNTAYASVAASILGKPEAEKMMRYLIDTKSQYDLYLLEQIIYVKSAKPFEGQNASFTYNKDGKEEKVSLNRLGMNFISMSKPDFEKAGFKVTSGNVGVKAFYIGNAADALDRENNKIKVIKQIGQKVDKVGLNEVIPITIYYDCPKGLTENGITIDDYIPTGMRFVGFEPSSSNLWFVQSREGQKIRLSMGNIIGKGERMPVASSGKLTYLVRSVTPGKYIVDSAFAASDEGTVWGMSEKSEVTIGE